MKLRRWQFLLISILLMLIVLALGTGRYFALVRQERLEEIRQIEEENERLIKKARQAQEQIRIMDERLVELEEMLLNLQRTEQIVSGTLPSRGGRQYTVTTMPLLSPSGFSPARFERAFKGTPLAGIGEALVQAEAETGINALVLAAIAAHESGWGRSRIAKEKNNLAGLGAYDHSPGSAIRFENREECVMFLAELLRDRPGSLEEIGGWYASDPRWAAKAGRCMKIIAEAGQ
ncbi:glucosaminidase domain-containing protein [Candidatus Darwinibacter acetoxidans]